MKDNIRFANIKNRFGTLGRFRTVLSFVLFVIALAGVPEDISTWGERLKGVLPLSDYLFGMIMGVAVTVLAYETSPLWMLLFKWSTLKPDISLIEVVQRASMEYKSPTFDVPGFEEVLWNALAGGRITTWGRELLPPVDSYTNDPTLWPDEEKIHKEFWKSNKIDLDTAGFFAGTSENTYGEEGQKTYAKLRFNTKQLENAEILNSDFKGN